MSSRIRLTAIALLALTSASRPAAAQLRTESALGPAGRRVTLAPEAYVRISRGGARSEGRAQQVAGDAPRRATDAGPMLEVPVSPSDTVWTLRRNTARGAGIGAAVGGVGLGGFGFLLARGLCESSDCGGEAMGFGLVSAMAGALGGAMLGGVAGSLVRTWRQIDP